MIFQKQSILQIEKSYSLNIAHHENGPELLIGSEIKGHNYRFNWKTKDSTTIGEEIGGTMTMLPLPRRSADYVSVMGMYPPFLGETAGAYFNKFLGNNAEWETRQVLSLPFAHRLEILQGQEHDYLFVASVAEHKENPEDWSQPGKVFATVIHEDLNPADFELVAGGITRNHGMIVHRFKDGPALLVSGKEGILAIRENPGGSTRFAKDTLFKNEVSEMFLHDLDGDGEDELVTIEPFHGNKLAVYKKIDDNWFLKFSNELSFGHGLWVGDFNETPTIFVGNRADHCDLYAYQPSAKGSLEFTRNILEPKTGTTQTIVFEYQNQSILAASNPLNSEVACYTQTEAAHD